MNDTYWWLKTNGEYKKIDAKKYHELLDSGCHTLVHSYGKKHLILSKGKSVLYLDAEQLYDFTFFIFFCNKISSKPCLCKNLLM